MPSSDISHPIYWSELKDVNATRYDVTRAQASDEGLRWMWIIYSALFFIFSMGIVVVFLGIITNRQVRKNPFNKFLLFLSVPDLSYTFLCFITCLWSAVNGSYVSWDMCRIQVFYLYSGASANSWLNGVMAWEIYRLLKSSQIRMRYFPPTDYQVYRNAAICYCIAIFTGSLPLIADALGGEEYFPTPGIQSGFLCQPTELTWVSTVMFWFVMAPLVFAIPYVYATYVYIDVVWYSKLLPPKGRRRDLSIYFFRIVAMFAFLWSPTFIVMFAFRGLAPPWWVWAFGAFSHTQGLVSACLTLLKDDIRGAVWHFVTHPCTCLHPDDQYKPHIPTVMGPGSSTGWGSSLKGFRTASRMFRKQQREADAMGLPIQGEDFQFIDEPRETVASSNVDSSHMHHGPKSEEPHGHETDDDEVSPFDPTGSVKSPDRVEVVGKVKSSVQSFREASRDLRRKIQEAGADYGVKNESVDVEAPDEWQDLTTEEPIYQEIEDLPADVPAVEADVEEQGAIQLSHLEATVEVQEELDKKEADEREQAK